MTPTLSRPKRVVYSVVLMIGLAVVAEVGDYLLLGFTPDTDWHSNEARGYSKYQRRTTVHETGRGGLIRMRINSDGFRGLTDFAKPKPPAVFRIVALGESSTFGLGNADDETYPYLRSSDEDPQPATRDGDPRRHPP